VQNVARGLKIKSNERHEATGPLKAGRDFPTKQELKALIDSAPDRWRAYFVTAIFTGMRSSELRGLLWSDIDLANATLHVRQRADQWGQIGPPKSGAGRRDIPLAPIVVNALRRHRLASPGEFVFINTEGGILLPHNFYTYVWAPLLKTCGLDYKFHSLRHAAASLYIELGWAPKRIQSVMGHSSITMTFDRYGHLFPQGDVGADMLRLEAAITAA
jgi:integrase